MCFGKMIVSHMQEVGNWGQEEDLGISKGKKKRKKKINKKEEDLGLTGLISLKKKKKKRT